MFSDGLSEFGLGSWEDFRSTSGMLSRLPWGLAKMLGGLLFEDSGEREPGSKFSKGAAEGSKLGNRLLDGRVGDEDSSSPRRSEGSSASARGLIGGFPLSVRNESDGSLGSGIVMPLLMLKKAGPGGKVGDPFPMWP